MTLWDLCIRRPIFTVMIVSAPLILGLVAYRRLPVDLFPNVDVPVVTITTTLRGASVEEMETGITKPIEEIVNTVAGIDELRSTTKEGISQITVQFLLEKNGGVAAQEVDAKVRTILSNFPRGTDAPIIDRFELDAMPVLTISVSGRRDMREVTELARKKIKEDLETIPGVGTVVLVGARTRAINILIEPDRLLKYNGLSIEMVRQALIRENQEQPGGRVDQGAGEIVLRTVGRVEKPYDFENLIIANYGGQPVRIRDIGRVEDSSEESRGLSRLWIKVQHESYGPEYPGENAVSLLVKKQSGTNTVEMVDRIKARLEAIRPFLPADLRTEVIRDQSRFIKNSIEEVQKHLILAAILVSLTMMLFIRDWRTTVIATMSIPTSIIATFAFMYAMGYSLNNITMLGLILAVGIVIDDAVVVHENIFRHMEEYKTSALVASGAATSEIALAVVATTLSLLVIFMPVIFMEGRVGRFFSSFGAVVGFSIAMSMFVSFTMTPMLCSRFLKPEGEGHTSKSGIGWRVVEAGYLWMLRWALRNRWSVVAIAVVFFLSTPVLMGIVGKNFIPRDDTSEFEVAITLPEGYSLDRADRVCREIAQRLQQIEGVTHTFTVIGDTSGRMTRGQGDVTTANIYARIVDIQERTYTQFDVQRKARVVMADYPDLRVAVQDVSAIQASGFRQVMVDLNLCGPDMKKLQIYSEKIADFMRRKGGFVDVDTSLSLRKPELRIRPDRERASDLGVSIETISTTANVLVGGEPVAKYKEFDEQYDVWLRAEPTARRDRDTIARLTVPSSKPDVGVVRLESVASLDPASGPSAIDRFGRQRQVVISANLEGKSMSEGVDEITEFVETLELPVEYRAEFIGQAKNLKETNNSFAVAFLLAGIFMYMILAAQFESIVHPISILIALPLTIPCAILSLILLQTDLEVYGLFGLFMLFGIVKKNGILQVDYTNFLRKRGLSRDEAILEANATRLRPILMTTVMLVAAMIPMALGQGPGAGARAGMAKVILGGQTLSLLLTLLLTPVVYSLFDDLGVLWARWTGKEKTEEEVLSPGGLRLLE